jgi:Domain of unknown function (DUF4476)
VKIDRSLAIAACAAVVVVSALPAWPVSRGQTAPAPGRVGEMTPQQARREVDQITKDLREARALSRSIAEKSVREQMERLLSRAELRARDLSDALAKAGRPQPAAPAAISAADFERLLNGLKQEAFDDRKFTYIENFASKAPLSCAQATVLLKSFAFDDGRLKAVKLLYPKLVDPQNFNDVLSAFVFKKAEARNAVGLK